LFTVNKMKTPQVIAIAVTVPCIVLLAALGAIWWHVRRRQKLQDIEKSRARFAKISLESVTSHCATRRGRGGRLPIKLHGPATTHPWRPPAADIEDWRNRSESKRIRYSSNERGGDLSYPSGRDRLVGLQSERQLRREQRPRVIPPTEIMRRRGERASLASNVQANMNRGPAGPLGTTPETPLSPVGASLPRTTTRHPPQFKLHGSGRRGLRTDRSPSRLKPAIDVTDAIVSAPSTSRGYVEVSQAAAEPKTRSPSFKRAPSTRSLVHRTNQVAMIRRVEKDHVEHLGEASRLELERPTPTRVQHRQPRGLTGADIFEECIKNVMDEATSDNSDEMFVYSSNPAESLVMQSRHHSRTLDVSSSSSSRTPHWESIGIDTGQSINEEESDFCSSASLRAPPTNSKSSPGYVRALFSPYATEEIDVDESEGPYPTGVRQANTVDELGVQKIPSSVPDQGHGSTFDFEADLASDRLCSQIYRHPFEFEIGPNPYAALSRYFPSESHIDSELPRSLDIQQNSWPLPYSKPLMPIAYESVPVASCDFTAPDLSTLVNVATHCSESSPDADVDAEEFLPPNSISPPETANNLFSCPKCSLQYPKLYLLKYYILFRQHKAQMLTCPQPTHQSEARETL
jgi:hypothetical protein